MRTLWQDIKYGLRMLAKSPGLTVVVVLTLALCIGANTAIFSVVNDVLLNPLPQKDAAGLVAVRSFDKEDAQFSGVNGPTWQDLRHIESLLSDLVVYGGAVFDWQSDDFVERVEGCEVSTNFFDFWQVAPLLGRTFAPDEDKPGSPPVIILSHKFWRSRYGGRPDIVGQAIQFKNGMFTVIGVMPPHVRFPGGVSFWLPWEGPHPGRGGMDFWYWSRSYGLMARLAPGVTMGQLQSVLDTIAQRQAADYPEQCRNETIRACPLRHMFSSDEVRKTLLSLLGAIVFVLLIACTNVANLLLARNEARGRELALRAALGAGRLRLVRQLLTESILLAMVGGLSGLLVAWCGARLLRSSIPAYMASIKPVGLDLLMLSFTLLVSLATGVAVGLMPAWFASHRQVDESLKQSASSGSLSPDRKMAGRLLVVSEVAMAVILLAGAGLMINSVIRLLSVDPGFDPTNLLKVQMYAYFYGERGIKPDVKRQLIREMVERFALLPGVERVGIVCDQHVDIDKYLVDGSDQPVTVCSIPVGVGPDDPLCAMRAPLLAGRYFNAGDQTKGQNTIIVNETLARLCWPGQDPIGKRLRFADEKNQVIEVVGMVGDVRDFGYEDRPGPVYYRPLENYPNTSLQWYSVFVRTRADPAAIIPLLRREIKAVAPGIRMPSFRVVQELLYDSTADERAYMSYLSGFAAAGLFLSMIGIYGMLAWTVARRTKEIGIRMALGARPGRILGMVLRDGLTMIFTGLMFGIVGALALTRVISGFLYEVSPTDPVTFAAVALFLIAVSLLACYLPARRATRVDPMVALRYE